MVEWGSEDSYILEQLIQWKHRGCLFFIIVGYSARVFLQIGDWLKGVNLCQFGGTASVSFMIFKGIKTKPNRIIKSQKQSENLENSKREATYHMQRIFDKINT